MSRAPGLVVTMGKARGRSKKQVTATPSAGVKVFTPHSRTRFEGLNARFERTVIRARELTPQQPGATLKSITIEAVE